MMIRSIVSRNFSEVKQFLTSQFAGDMHSKRLTSLSDGVTGVLASQSLRLSKIGEGLAAAKGVLPKHAKKQVDRLLSNEGVDIEFCQARLAKLLMFHRRRIIVAMDWTVFAKDQQVTLTLRLITKHGRATPLLWQTVSTIGLKGHKNEHVLALFKKLRCLIPQDTQVIVLADREFGTLKNMALLKETLRFDYILRIKRNFTIADKTRTKKKLAHEWLDANKLTCVDDAYITVQEYQINKVVICKEPDMKEMWCLACSIKNIATKTILKLYAKRWGTETSYRDEKDLHFGLGLKKSRIKNPKRRDRLFLLSAIAIILLTLLGAASEAVGFDKYIKSNTTKQRTHSLFAQGRLILKIAPTLKNQWLNPILAAMDHLLGRLNFITDDLFVV
jgi:hypothetical protein